jgi:hypothetical protein
MSIIFMLILGAISLFDYRIREVFCYSFILYRAIHNHPPL